MRTDIVVIGGYGHVGGQICMLLGEKYPGVVYAAGRNLERAKQFSEAAGGSVKPMRIDAGEKFNARQMNRVRMVVMCLDQQDTSFAEACLSEGIHYIDVTANVDFFSKMAVLSRSGSSYGAAAVLSVGLAPGLTNLLAGEARRSMDEVQQLDISVMLGLGDSHGQAAIEWTVDNLTAEFAVKQAGKNTLVGSFSAGRTVDWGEGLGRRRAYRFPFSDQTTLAGTLQIPSVSTRLCFDSRLATGSLALLQKLGLLRLVKGKRIRSMTVASFGKIRFGTDRYAIKVEAAGLNNGAPATAEYVIQGSREAEITARVAALVSGAIYSSGHSLRGIYHLEQLFRIGLEPDRLSLRLQDQTQAAGAAGGSIDGISSWSRHS